jgi:signal transduction histidine kinase
MYRALAVLRVVLLVNALVLFYAHRGDYRRPAAGDAVMVALVLWTGLAVWAYAAASRRRWPLAAVDVAVAVAAMGLTGYVKGPWSSTLPGFWVAGAVLAAAVHWRLVGGVLAAAVVAATDALARDGFTQTDYGNVFLLLVGGPVVGFLSGLLQRVSDERDRALRATAVAAERQRLARAVHDGVLQVLTLVQRRGAELGGEAAELGRLAGEQEVALRALVHGQDAPAPPTGAVDLAAALTRLGTSGTSVVVPGPAPLDADRAEELVAAVGACLSNVRHHVGRDAPAWVLLEDLGDRYVVSVRDEGPGIPPGRLEEAAAQGRLGVRSSICDRIAELGGTAALHTSPAGTEWELTVPKAGHQTQRSGS